MSIGIFWVYKGVVIGKKCSIEEGEESFGGLIDTEFSHYKAWEIEPEIRSPFPELEHTEYQQFPRGRVIYSKSEDRFWIYTDQQLMNKEHKNMIRDFFDLEGEKIKWFLDPHYRTFECLLDEMN